MIEPTETAPRMTVAEIALMREIVKWRKAHEIEFVRNRHMGTYWIDSFGRTGEKRRIAAIELREVKTLGVSPDRYTSYEWYAVASVTQGVDLLAALGYLPARFSSAYRMGWDAAMDAEFQRAAA